VTAILSDHTPRAAAHRPMPRLVLRFRALHHRRDGDEGRSEARLDARPRRRRRGAAGHVARRPARQRRDAELREAPHRAAQPLRKPVPRALTRAPPLPSRTTWSFRRPWRGSRKCGVVARRGASPIPALFLTAFPSSSALLLLALKRLLPPCQLSSLLRPRSCSCVSVYKGGSDTLLMGQSLSFIGTFKSG
jgi:hypothetical protein